MRSVRLVVAFLAAALFAAPAVAGEDAADSPEFLLGDLGVRVDLPSSWNMTRWSDWDLKAESRDPILLQAWGTEIQTDPSKVDVEVWAPIYEAKLAEMGAGEGIGLDSAEGATVQGQPAAFFDYSFKLKSGTPAVLKGATIAVEGQMFHLALVSVSRFEKKVERTREELMEKLEILEGPAEVTWGPTLEGDGFTHTLPEGWRAPLESEMGPVNKQIANLGLEKLDGCWLAMRPKGPAAPDAMVACQGGKLLGVVDTYSFAGVEPAVRETMFGGAEVPAAAQIDLPDRVGFLYDLNEKGLAVAVVPYDKGVVRIWARGEAGDASLATDLKAALEGSTYSGPHPAGIGDQVGYYVAYRPFSPMVLCPVLGILLLGGGLAFGGFLLLGGKKDKYADLAED